MVDDTTIMAHYDAEFEGGKQSRHPNIASSHLRELFCDADQRGVSQGNRRRAAGTKKVVEDRVDFGDLDGVP